MIHLRPQNSDCFIFLHRAPGQVPALRPCVTSTAFSSYWHARLHLQGPGMLRLKVSTPGTAIQFSNLFCPDFIFTNAVVK